MGMLVKPSGDFVAVKVRPPFWGTSKALGVIERTPRDALDRGWAMPSGEVVAIGEGVSHVTVGDRVLFLSDTEYVPGYPEAVVLVREGDIAATLEEGREEAKAEAKAEAGGVLSGEGSG